MSLKFEVLHTTNNCSARIGRIHTAHGTIDTPVFMPVGTQATVKSVTPEELDELGAQIILGNTYHLYLRPGHETIRRLGGLHKFMHWHGPILTDSGGFQVFSLAKLRKITDEGVTFQSHIDGSSHTLTPKKAIEIQEALGSDIMMCLDECTPYPATHEESRKSLELTLRWARQCKMDTKSTTGALFGIVQGGMYSDLRAESIAGLLEIGFDGYALGGLSVGEPKEVMLEVAEHALPLLPATMPRYVMGVGMPEDLVELAARGADMFDCVIPTRNARNGQLFVASGTVNISNAEHKEAGDPVEEGCACYTCQHYSRAYLRHLFMAKELLAYRLTTIHNIHFFLRLMDQIRSSIHENRFSDFQKDFYAKRNGGCID